MFTTIIIIIIVINVVIVITTTIVGRKKGVYYTGITLYNKLPNSIRDKANNYHQFRIILKKFLRNNPFYSIEEYLNNDFNNML